MLPAFEGLIFDINLKYLNVKYLFNCIHIETFVYCGV